MNIAKFFTHLLVSISFGILGVLLFWNNERPEGNPNIAEAEKLGGICIGAFIGLILGWYSGGYLRKKYLFWRYPCGGGQEDPETVWSWWR